MESTYALPCAKQRNTSIHRALFDANHSDLLQLKKGWTGEGGGGGGGVEFHMCYSYTDSSSLHQLYRNSYESCSQRAQSLITVCP